MEMFAFFKNKESCFFSKMFLIGSIKNAACLTDKRFVTAAIIISDNRNDIFINLKPYVA